MSVDGGETFTNDIGPLDSSYTLPAREANITLHNPAERRTTFLP